MVICVKSGGGSTVCDGVGGWRRLVTVSAAARRLATVLAGRARPARADYPGRSAANRRLLPSVAAPLSPAA